MIYFCVATAPAEAAPALARRLVEERLAACVNILPGVRSLFRWEGETRDEEEAVLFIKTAPRTAGGFEARFRELHPYDCPELLMIPVEQGLEEYFQWVIASTGATGATGAGERP